MISSNSSTEQTDEAVPETVAPDPAPRPSRRLFTARYKLAVVAQYEAARRHRRRLGRRRYNDEVFLFRGTVTRYLYRAADEHGQVVDVLLRERRDRGLRAGILRARPKNAETQPAAIV